MRAGMRQCSRELPRVPRETSRIAQYDLCKSLVWAVLGREQDKEHGKALGPCVLKAEGLTAMARLIPGAMADRGVVSRGTWQIQDTQNACW